MATKVLLHVGSPKTGTSQLQDYLFRHPRELAKRGIFYPGERFDQHFLAALDLMQLPWGGLELEAIGAWDKLAAEVRAWERTAIVSHEILARASRAQVERALSSFGGAEVHVVLSVRDLVRQIPAEYQENIKHRRVLSYENFLAQLEDPSRTGNIASWFWAVQDVPDILDRWASGLGPDRVHLVTVPHRGASEDVLAKRFAEAFGIDAAALAEHGSRANPSLGAAETALLRRLNQAVVPAGIAPPHHYRDLVRELIAHRTLSRRSTTPRLGLPPRVAAWASQVCDEWVDELGRRGYHVVGDLEDLRAAADDGASRAFADPDHPDEALVAEAGLDALVALLEELRRSRERVEALEQDLRASTERLPFVERLKQQVVRRERTNPLVGGLLRIYRRRRRR